MMQPISDYYMHLLGVVSVYCAPRMGYFLYTFFYNRWVLLPTTAQAQTKPEQSLEVFGATPFKGKITHKKAINRSFAPLIWLRLSIFTTRNTTRFLSQQNATMPRHAYGFIASGWHDSASCMTSLVKELPELPKGKSQMGKS